VAESGQRVLEGKRVPAREKLVSLFELHTGIIWRGKVAPHEMEFGIKA